MQLHTHKGKCHCSAVRFEVLLPAKIKALEFNYSICRMNKSFYIPRSNPDGLSVNLRCLDIDGFSEVVIKDFDGVNWDKSAGDLKHLT